MKQRALLTTLALVLLLLSFPLATLAGPPHPIYPPTATAIVRPTDPINSDGPRTRTPTVTQTPTSTSTPTRTPVPTSTRIFTYTPLPSRTPQPTSTPVHTWTPIPTRTPPPPTGTRTPRDTRTPTATRSATGTPTATATASATEVVYHWLAVGDSKTWGAGDDEGGLGYPPLLTALLSQSGPRWAWQRIAQGGITTAGMRAKLALELPSYPASPPPVYILINLGVNDVAEPPTANEWLADYGGILALLHNKWPAARVGLMRVGMRTSSSRAALLDTIDNRWMPMLLSGRPWVSLGPDERDFLWRPDYPLLPDGIHPDHDGYIATARAWLATLPC